MNNKIVALLVVLSASGVFAADELENVFHHPPAAGGSITVAAYYYACTHPDPRWDKNKYPGYTEWDEIKAAKPRFPGHVQPKPPLWGYQNEALPEVMAQKINAAADYGVNAFIFDWYYYNDGPYLEAALDEGFLHATNNTRVKFALMWANHDWYDIQGYNPADKNLKLLYPGKVTTATWDKICDLVIARYFKHPSYWLVDGKPYFSIYEMSKFLDSFGSIENARAALDEFRAKVRAAGFSGLHVNAIVWGQPNLPGGKTPPGWPKLCRDLALDSLTSYTWVHHGALNNATFPVSDYLWGRQKYLSFWARAQTNYSIPYFPNAMVSWDNSPRAAADADWSHPAGPTVNSVVTGNTPAAFQQSLEIIKQRLLAAPTQPKIITINAWNEWPEGSCLEPMQQYGYGYLEAVKTVFAATNATSSTPAEGITVEPSGASLEVLKESPAQRDARMAWWREAKFGLFIHWGVYSVPAGKYGDNTNYGEWIMNSAKIPVAKYREFASRFNPVKYNPELWVKTAKDAGMKYIVITSKHHDGFTLYPSAASKWNIADATPYKKDLLGPLVQAAHAEGLKIGFYYSQSQDWNNPGGAKSGFKEGEGWDDAHKGSYDEYLKNVAVPQVKEILTRYPIDILWWDTPMYMTPERAAPLAALTQLRPSLIMNNRLGGGFKGDTATPEQFVPVTGYPGDWETCMTLNGHWGYNAYDQNWKSATDLIHKLADICAKGGNFLLNVGPTSEGEFPPACVERLRNVGQWLHVNGDAIYGTSGGPFPYLAWGVGTRKGGTLYLHVFDWPKDGKLVVPLSNQAKSATLLASGEKLFVTSADGKLAIQVPAIAPDVADSVIALEIKGNPVTSPLPTAGARVTASAEMKGSEAANAIDGTGEKRWRAPQEVKSAWLELELKQSATIGAFGLDEPDVWPRLNQKFMLEAFVGGEWKNIAGGKTNGHGTKQSIAPVNAQKFRLTMECDTGAPGVAELQLYSAE